MTENVLLVGATMLDTKGVPESGLEPETSNPGRIRFSRGGTARNVAENLARLGANARLITAVGDDVNGRLLLEATREAGVDLEFALTVPDEHTGSYMALMNQRGALAVAVDDVHVMAHITPGYLNRHRRLFRDADMVVIDGSLTEKAILTVVRLATRYGTPLCADPSSARLASKVRPHIPHLNLLVPNEVEASELLQVDYGGYDPDASLALARQLVQLGAEQVVITLSDFGLDYATSDETGYIPPSYRQIADPTGTGDAVTAAVIFGRLNNLPTIEAMRLGAAAASLTLQTTDSVVADLSLDMLYDHLII